MSSRFNIRFPGSVLSLAVLLLYVQNFFAEGSQKPPNILWVIGEDLGPELGCYGHPEVWTPNLDSLARKGVRYTHAYTTSPVCSPSRSALMTGMYQTSVAAHNHRSHRDDRFRLPAGVDLITDLMRRAGYFTANIVSLTSIEGEDFYKGTGKTDWNFTYDGEPFDSDQWQSLKDHQPFYAQINFSETHRGSSWDTAHQRIDKRADPLKVRIPPYYPDHPVTRKDWAQYLNSVMALDRKVGFVLDLLEKDGLAQNTVVMFFGDNGRAMIRGKQWPYESGLHVPLLIYWPPALGKPDGYEPGSVDDQLIVSIDLTATSLWISGVTPPLTMQGRSFLGEESKWKRKYVFGGRDRGDETVDRIRSVRNNRYRYIRNFFPEKPFLQLNRYKEWTYPVLSLMRKLYQEGGLDEVQSRLMAPTRSEEELYDLASDPYEIRNLADNPAYHIVKTELAAALETWMYETNDQGRHPEDPEIHQFWENRMKQNYESREKKTIDPAF